MCYTILPEKSIKLLNQSCFFFKTEIAYVDFHREILSFGCYGCECVVDDNRILIM